MSEVELLARIVVRWAQANRKNELMDWHCFTDWLMGMAEAATRNARTPDEVEHADDLHALAEVAYLRGEELFRHAPYLIYAEA